MTPCGVRRIARSLDFCPASSVSRVPDLPGPREPYWVAMNPLRSAVSRYLPGAIPAMANCPAASVTVVWLTWTVVTPGDISMRRKDTNARRTGSPVAAFETWPLTAHKSSGLVCAASASGNHRSAAIHRMVSGCDRLWDRPSFFVVCQHSEPAVGHDRRQKPIVCPTPTPQATPETERDPGSAS